MNCDATALVVIPNAESAFAHLLKHAEEHDVVLDKTGPRDFKILVGKSHIAIGMDDTALSLTISAETISILYFLKEAAVQHLAEISPEAAESLRWEDENAGASDQTAPPSFHELSLVSTSEPIDGLIRVRLTGATEIAALAGPGIHVKLMLPEIPGRAPVWPEASHNGVTKWPDGDDVLHVRYYTIKALDLKTGEIDIDIVRHAGGVIADWAAAAQPGSKIGLLGPGGGEVPDNAKRVLLCGDKTALPALARMLETLPDGVHGNIVAEAAALDCLKAYLPATGLRLHALPEARFRQEIELYSERVTTTEKPDFAWFAGEHKNAQTMRKLFKGELGLKKGEQYAITYWRDGASLEAN